MLRRPRLSGATVYGPKPSVDRRGRAGSGDPLHGRKPTVARAELPALQVLPSVFITIGGPQAHPDRRGRPPRMFLQIC